MDIWAVHLKAIAVWEKADKEASSVALWPAYIPIEPGRNWLIACQYFPPLRQSDEVTFQGQEERHGVNIDLPKWFSKK